MEIAAFLVGSASFMTSDEMLALAHAMAQAGTQLTWDTPVVVDKHCIGGIPGNRTSMIVVPIAAAHGLTIPKTSSRAITSPAGTADTMEVLARVDLTVDEMKEVVKTCHGCLVWGGHVNLSPADDILISVERPLSLDTREQMVASIMSKKIAAGATHLLIDLPIGPAAKLRTALDAMRLRKLFEFVGDYFGIAVEVITTDGRQPIGNGIGPVLEAQESWPCWRTIRRRPPICARNRCGSPPTCSNMIRICAAERDICGRASCSIAARRSSRCTR
jgi:thymidine phosphorylase